ncbi:MAG: divergent polysaccharide deacetylase family protein [Azospirillaceae bacterium]
MSRRRSGGRAGGGRGGGALGLAVLVVAAAIGGVVLWAALRADETVETLRRASDAAALTRTVPVPEAAGAGTAAGDSADGGAGTPVPDGPETAASPPATEPAPDVGSTVVPEAVEAGDPLPAVAIPALLEPSPDGLLPRVGADGRMPRTAYAHPFDATDPRPRVAVVVLDMGMMASSTRTVIDRLPSEITLALDPYAADIDRWLADARTAGHEVLLEVPMEPVGYPADDPGPETLLSALDAGANRDRLHWALARTTGYVGIVNATGDRFATLEEGLRPVLAEIGGRGLIYVEGTDAGAPLATRLASALGVPRAAVDRRIGDMASRDMATLQLEAVEALAREQGAAVAIVRPLPSVLDRLDGWADGLADRGLVLAPISAVADLQPDRTGR